MTQRGYYLDSAVPAVQSSIDTVRHCAYNHSRQRFLSADVDAGDFSVAVLDARLLTITTNSGAGLWLLPFRGISPTSVRVPVDLIYLDRACTVLDVVESFPFARASASCAQPASVLVLPADAIGSTGTQRGDQLLLCSPGEMKRRLQELAAASVEARPDQTPAPVRETPVRPGSGRVIQWGDRFGSKVPVERSSTEEAVYQQLPDQPAFVLSEPQVEVPAELPPIEEPARVVGPVRSPEVARPSDPTGAVEPPRWKTEKPARSWLQRLLAPEPQDPRKSSRQSVSGLVAYFFTGGTPVPYAVRDISSTGIYVYTQERFYPGTMVRVTLTDRIDPAATRSITLNMFLVRAGDDGVGFKFVLQDPRSKAQHFDGVAIGADPMQVEQFLLQLRQARELAS